MVAVAREAGALTLRHFRQFRELEIGIKGPADFVSEADRESELLIRKRLFARYPDWSFTGEEFPPVDGGDPRAPLAGRSDRRHDQLHQRHALHHLDRAPARQRRRCAARSTIPVADEMFTAIRGQGAFLNGERLAGQPADRRRADGDRHRPADQLRFTAMPGFYRAARDDSRPDRRGRVVGSSANSCAYVACGRLTGYFEESGLVDWAVGVLLVEEAGGIVTDWWGRGPEFYEKTGLRHRRQPGDARLPDRQAEGCAAKGPVKPAFRQARRRGLRDRRW